ncbi:hypothetical protein D3C79_940080 [compost metagenome]
MRILRRQHHRGDLGLVADFSDEERDQGGQERAEAPCRTGFVVIHLVRNQRPQRRGSKAGRENPVQGSGAEEGTDPGTDSACSRMVGQGCSDDTGDDRPGFAKARGKDQREQLGLVANFGEGHDRGGDEQ